MPDSPAVQLIALVVLVFFSLIGIAFDVKVAIDSQLYHYAVLILLALGLYGSTSAIDVKEARSHLSTILAAVTVGVVIKAVAIGGVLAFIFDDAKFLLLGVVMAQIDPLSVAALMQDNSLSRRTRTILASWSSFDDPVTVLLSLAIAPVVAEQIGGDTSNLHGGFSGYSVSFLASIALAVTVYGAWRLCRTSKVKQLSLLVVGLAVGVSQALMLGIALIGLFIRPLPASWLGRATQAAFVVAAGLLGLLMSSGIDLLAGVALGTAAYVAQAAVAGIVAAKVPKEDRIELALAQQNGITAMILALLFEPVFGGIVGIVAPAIITCNALHAVMNSRAGRSAVDRVFRPTVMDSRNQ